jgi:hypothetical protein
MTSNDDIPLSGEPAHDTNRQSPAYALFTRRPIASQPRDVLAADPPAGTEDTPNTECPLPAYQERINPDQLPRELW